MLSASNMPVPGSPMVGPGLIGLPPGSPVMLIAPPQAWAIGSKQRPFSYGLPVPKPLTWGARVQCTDHVIAETQPFDRSAREVLGEDVGLQHHVLDQAQAT